MKNGIERMVYIEAEPFYIMQASQYGAEPQATIHDVVSCSHI